MSKQNNYKTFTEFIPQIFTEDKFLSEDFFDKIRAIVDFKNCYVFLLNSESIQQIYPLKQVFNFALNNSKDTENLKKLLNIKNEIFISNLSVKNIDYGFILYEKETFGSDETSILDAFTQILSYKIKDKELSEIFQKQVKTLSSAVIEVKNANIIKTEFIANVSHELRTPLNAIIGFSELLSNPLVGNLNDKQNNYVDDIKVSGLNLLGMINEILDISKIEANSMQLLKTKFTSSQLVDEVSNIVYPLMNKKNLHYEKDIDIFEINADFQKLQQVLFNLLSNAVKFTPENGKIILSVKNIKNSLEISVSDTGSGIEKANQKKIFDKFVQLNSTSETSTGLGLTIVKQFVKMHGGKISVKSVPNEGSTFTVKISQT